MSVFFLGDVVLSFMTPFVNQNGQPMSDHVSIARNYLSGWFWVDVPSSVPVELLTLFLPADSEMSALSALRFLRMFRLVRLLKLLKIQEHMNSAEEYLGVSLKPVRVLQLIILLCYVAHLLGCAWFYVASIGIERGEPTWLSEYEPSAVEGPWERQYMLAVYWAFTTLTTVGYGDITPSNDLERRFTTISLLLGSLVFAYVLGAFNT